MKRLCVSAGFLAYVLGQACAAETAASACEGKLVENWQNVPKVWKMQAGFATYAKVNINIDGYGRAYHRDNYKTDAVIHLCNAGEVILPDGSSYQGSESNATCTGKFMSDFARIEAAGWNDPKVGAIRWYGVLATGTALIRGRTIHGVKPVLQKDGSGYYVSPTTLFDKSIGDETQQERYVHPLKIPAAVVPSAIAKAGIRLGSFGVSFSPKTNAAVPFVIGDIGPKIGEATPALARQLARLPPSDMITRQTRYAGQVDTPSVLWIFFGDAPVEYRQSDPGAIVAAAGKAFEQWGGMSRLQACVKTVAR